MAAERLSLTLESRTVGTEDVLRLESTINRVLSQAEKARAAGDGVASATSKAGQSSAQFGQQISQFIRDPLGTASTAAETFITKLGPMGVGLGVVGAAAIAGGTALLSFIKSTGDAAEKILNLSITTGLSAVEVQQFSAALSLSGANIEDLEKASIKLNAQLSDTGTAGQKARKSLADIGVSLYDANGRIKEAGPLILDLSKGFAALTDRTERDRIGTELLGKAYRTLIPAITELSSNIDTVKKDGIGIDAKTLQQADELADKLGRVGTILEQNLTIAKSLAATLATPFLDAIIAPGPGPGSFQFGALPISGTQRAPASPAPEISARLFAPSASAATLIDPVRAGFIRAALAGGGTLESQRRDLSDLGSQIDSQRLKLQNLQNTPGLTEEAATREVNALRALEGQYKRLEGQIAAAEKAKRDFEKLNALGTFTVTDQFYAFGARSTPSLRRGAERNFPVGLGTFQVSEGDIAAANAGATGALSSQNRAFGAGLIAADQQARQGRVEDLRQELAFQSERLRLITGPGGELAAIRAIAQIRLEGVERELAITGDLRKADGERLQIARDRQLEELRYAKERDDRNRQTGGQVFDALLSGGAGIRGFASGLGLGAGRTAFGNLFSEFARNTTGLLSLPGQQNANGTPNFLGRVLAGTPFGLDPQKVALDANTIATQQNTAALLGGRVGGSVIGSILGGGGGGVSGLPAIFGGGSGSNPFIFSATGNSGGSSTPIFFGDGTPIIPSSGLSTASKVGSVAAAVGSGFLVKSGIQQGGVRGGLEASAGAAGAFAALAPLIGLAGPAAPIAAAVAVGLQVVKELLPDPRKKRSLEIQRQLEESKWSPGDVVGIDTDYARGGSIANTKGGVVVIVNTMDAKSFLDRRDDIAAAVSTAIEEGNTRLREGINRTVDLGSE